MPQLPIQPPKKPQPNIANPTYGHTCYIFSESHPISRWIAINPPGRFPTTSRRGTKYLLVLYGYEFNAILEDTMCIRMIPEHLEVYQRSNQTLFACGLRPKLQL